MAAVIRDTEWRFLSNSCGQRHPDHVIIVQLIHTCPSLEGQDGTTNRHAGSRREIPESPVNIRAVIGTGHYTEVTLIVIERLRILVATEGSR